MLQGVREGKTSYETVEQDMSVEIATLTDERGYVDDVRSLRPVGGDTVQLAF